VVIKLAGVSFGDGFPRDAENSLRDAGAPLELQRSFLHLSPGFPD
jgi:hypothetical protein